jgi:hypothetical protein
MASIKAKKAFKEITENNRSVSAAMRIAGYSKSSATKPKTLTETKGWKELVKEFLPDEDLAKAHYEGLRASEKVLLKGKVSLKKCIIS